MDTTWFAVDSSGAIGRFESSEDGAVPKAAASAGGSGDPNFDVWPLRAASGGSWLRENGAADGAPPTDEARAQVTAKLSEKPTRVVVLLRDARQDEAQGYRPDNSTTDAEQLIDEAQRWVIFGDHPRVIASRTPVSVEVQRALGRHPGVTAMIDEDALSDLWWESLSTREAGLFVFGHDHRGEGPGAYKRQVEPNNALSVAQLPIETQRALSAQKLPVAFASAPLIQLADHLSDDECATWGGGPLRADPTAPQAPQPAVEPRTKSSVIITLAIVIAVLIALVRRVTER
jgi:hypothetical protein